MKRLLSATLFLFLSASAFAGSWTDSHVRSAGTYVETSFVTITSYTATALYTSDVWDVNLDIFNNSAYVLYVGTNTTTLLTSGFPILSSNTYTLDGQYTGALYGMVDSTTNGNQNIRIIRYKRFSTY